MTEYLPFFLNPFSLIIETILSVDITRPYSSAIYLQRRKTFFNIRDQIHSTILVFVCSLRFILFNFFNKSSYLSRSAIMLLYSAISLSRLTPVSLIYCLTKSLAFSLIICGSFSTKIFISFSILLSIVQYQLYM